MEVAGWGPRRRARRREFAVVCSYHPALPEAGLDGEAAGRGEGTEPGAGPHAPGWDIKALLGLGQAPGGPPCGLCSGAAVGCPGGREGQDSVLCRFVAAPPDGPLLRTAA